MDREREIREIAHRIWEEEGRPEGHSEEHWLKAEAIWRGLQQGRKVDTKAPLAPVEGMPKKGRSRKSEMRLQRHEKEALARKIIAAALGRIEDSGDFIRVGRILKGMPKEVSFGDLKIMHMTPFVRAPGAPAPYGLDIWRSGKGKVFSVWWGGEKDALVITRFNYGPWMNDLVPDSFPGK